MNDCDPRFMLEYLFVYTAVSILLVPGTFNSRYTPDIDRRQPKVTYYVGWARPMLVKIIMSGANPTFI